MERNITVFQCSHIFLLYLSTTSDQHSTFSVFLCVCSGGDDHPAVQEGENVTDYQLRTEQYWMKVARANMGPDSKDKKVAKVAAAMAKVFYEDQ